MKTKINDLLAFYTRFKKCIGFVIFSVFLTMISCDNNVDSENNPYDKPHESGKPVVVSDIGPKKGGYGTRVVISGSNFGNDPEIVNVYFNEKKALILDVQDNAIYAMCPKQPGEFSNIKVVVQENEGRFIESELVGTQFKYLIRAVVTTVAGVLGQNKAIDGPALEASFVRPSKIACDINGNVVITDDNAGRIRLLSMKDNKVVTVAAISSPFSNAFNTQNDKCFVAIRAANRRPELFACLYKSTNYMSPVMFYDQEDQNGNYIFGNSELSALSADDQYVYLLTLNATKLIRVHQVTGKVELIGEKLDIPSSFIYTTFSPKDRKVYAFAEYGGRLYRFDPYHTPAGKTTPWITNKEVEYVLGNGSGAAREGYGDQARCPCAGITADYDGNLYGADIVNHVVWKFDVFERSATIFAGTPGKSGYKDGKPLEAILGRPMGIGVTPDGLVYIGETTNFLIRKISVQ